NTFTSGVSNTAGGVGAMKLYKVETANVAVTDGTLSASGSDRLSVTVSPGATTRLAVTATGSTMTAGGTKDLTVTALDPYGNTDASYTGAHTVTFAGANSSASPATAPTVVDKDGNVIAFGTGTPITFTNGVATVLAGANG